MRTAVSLVVRREGSFQIDKEIKRTVTGIKQQRRVAHGHSQRL